MCVVVTYDVLLKVESKAYCYMLIVFRYDEGSNRSSDAGPAGGGPGMQASSFKERWVYAWQLYYYA